ncbi:MAG TPA: hypothetical protein V6D23_28130, partial [Candidatus Obscuribacterales bacterium]
MAAYGDEINYQQIDVQSLLVQPGVTAAEAASLQVLDQWLQTGQEQKISAWAHQQPDKGRQLQAWLLADELYAGLSQVPPTQPRGLALLQALFRAHPIPQWQPYLDLLLSPDFLNLAYAHRQHDNEDPLALDSPPRTRSYSSTAWDRLLEGLDNHLHNLDHLPELTQAEPDIEGHGYLSYVSLNFSLDSEDDSEKVVVERILPLQYLRAKNEAIALAELITAAGQQGQAALRIQAMLDLAELMTKGQAKAAVELLEKALQEARSLDSPMLEVRTLLALARHEAEPTRQDNFLQHAVQRVEQVPEGDVRLCLNKLLADHWLASGQIEQARQMYRKLAKNQQAWLQDWLLKSIARTRDAALRPLAEAALGHADPTIRHQASRTWIEVTPLSQRLKVLKARVDLPPADLAGLLAVVPLMTDKAYFDYLRPFLQQANPLLQRAALQN